MENKNLSKFRFKLSKFMKEKVFKKYGILTKNSAQNKFSGKISNLMPYDQDINEKK